MVGRAVPELFWGHCGTAWESSAQKSSGSGRRRCGVAGLVAEEGRANAEPRRS